VSGCAWHALPRFWRIEVGSAACRFFLLGCHTCPLPTPPTPSILPYTQIFPPPFCVPVTVPPSPLPCHFDFDISTGQPGTAHYLYQLRVGNDSRIAFLRGGRHQEHATGRLGAPSLSATFFTSTPLRYEALRASAVGWRTWIFLLRRGFCPLVQALFDYALGARYETPFACLPLLAYFGSGVGCCLGWVCSLDFCGCLYVLRLLILCGLRCSRRTTPSYNYTFHPTLPGSWQHVDRLAKL